MTNIIEIILFNRFLFMNLTSLHTVVFYRNKMFQFLFCSGRKTVSPVECNLDRRIWLHCNKHILFSILIFGDLCGFVGMVIGVPTFSVIYFLISKFVFQKLREKEMDTVVEDYRSRYPDRRQERDARNVQKNLGKAQRLEKWGKFVGKFKK